LSQIYFIPYYNWQYAKENGFLKWLFLGEVVAFGKAFAWPYFVFFDKPSSNLSHFIKSINYSNEAAKLSNQGKPFESVDKADMKKFIDLKKKALEEAKLVNIEQLNRDHPNFGNHYRDEFMKGLRLLIEGYEKEDNGKIIEASILFDRWGDWYSSNLENIRKGNKTEIEPKVESSISMPEAPKLNASELDRYSTVLKRAGEAELKDTDLGELRSTMSDYTKRTGRKMTNQEYSAFIGIIKLSNDYFYELGQSLLYSWDNKKIITTNNFDSLYQKMKVLGMRKEVKLKADMECLKAAARNENYGEDEFGQKYKLGREVILRGIKENELLNSNMQKIATVVKEFVE
jgi:hypothetical protein